MSISWDGIQERRRHPRAAVRLRIACGGAGRNVEERVETLNLSAGGFYCRVDHAVEPLTRLGLSFVFPAFGAVHTQERRVDCEAVVVRCDSDAGHPTLHRIAACFTRLSPGDRRLVEEYVDWYQEVYGDSTELEGRDDDADDRGTRAA